MQSTYRFCIIFLIVAGIQTGMAQTAPTHYLNIKNSKELKDFFHYTKDRVPFISSHRGGPLKDFPENCTATFNNTLSHTWSLMEMDPHYTKDSAIVVMHDPTLDRTSTGHGKISDVTLEELKQFRLKDPEGNVTPYPIPTFDEILEWAKGKTLLVVDMKDVPIAARVKKLEEHHMEANAIVIAYSFEDAKKCYQLNKNIIMEVMMPDSAAVAAFDSTGVPWANVVAFVTHTQPKNNNIFQLVHDRGALCIVGSSRTVDKAFTTGKISRPELAEGHRRIIESGADIIEADLGIEAGADIEQLRPGSGSKKKYFK